jgi:hypothetical protein
MKRVVASLGVFLVCAGSVYAREYQSLFGFAASIPDDWVVLTKQAVKENPALLDVTGSQLGSITPERLKELMAKIEKGSLEMMFSRATSDAVFADNINVLVRSGQIPVSPDKLAQACEAFSAKLAKTAGRALAVAHCEGREAGGFKAVYLEYEGVIPGTVTMQYQIQRPNNALLQMTATCKQASLEKVRAEFGEFVRSIRFS